MNKQICLIILFIPLQVFSQEGSGSVRNYQEIDYKAVHFGFSLGTNISDFTFIRNKNAISNQYLLFADLQEPFKTIGFNVNIVSEFRLNKYFAFRFTPGLILTANRPIDFMTLDTANKPNILATAELESNYLDFPLHIKFSSKRINNYRPYLLAGTSIRYDLVARKNYEENQIIKLRKSPPIDISYDIGFGIDFYMVYFKFSTELKLSTGIVNVLHDKAPAQNTMYYNTLDGLRSSLIILSFNFE